MMLYQHDEGLRPTDNGCRLLMVLNDAGGLYLGCVRCRSVPISSRPICVCRTAFTGIDVYIYMYVCIQNMNLTPVEICKCTNNSHPCKRVKIINKSPEFKMCWSEDGGRRDIDMVKAGIQKNRYPQHNNDKRQAYQNSLGGVFRTVQYTSCGIFPPVDITSDSIRNKGKNHGLGDLSVSQCECPNTSTETATPSCVENHDCLGSNDLEFINNILVLFTRLRRRRWRIPLSEMGRKPK